MFCKNLSYLFFSQYLLQIFQPNALDGMYHHPQQGHSWPYQDLPLLPRGPHVEHDVADKVIVETERSLMGKLRNEPVFKDDDKIFAAIQFISVENDLVRS